MTTETDGLNSGPVDLWLRDEANNYPQPTDPPTTGGGGANTELPGEIQQTPQPAVVPPDGDE